jgi:hypothetical protein
MAEMATEGFGCIKAIEAPWTPFNPTARGLGATGVPPVLYWVLARHFPLAARQWHPFIL